MEYNTKSILKDLKKFGLNPSDWTLSRTTAPKNPSVVIEHKKEKNFKLLAQFAGSGMRGPMTELCLYSI